MFEKFIPIIIALIALQFIMRFMNKRKSMVQESEWRKADYKKRRDAIMKGRDPDEEAAAAPKGMRFLGVDDFNAIPEEMRGVRRDIIHIRDAVSAGLRAKIGRDAGDSKYNEPEKMFDEIVEVINRHMKRSES